jgi:4'-phosphopantetheinyl transferase
VGFCDVYLARLRYLESRHLELLDPIETGRRAQLREVGDRDRYGLAAALLRTVVGRRTAVDPGKVVVDRTCEICGGPHGRPRLAKPGLETSISHSADLVAVALTNAGPVGVDVEVVAERGWEPLVPLVCTPDEASSVHTSVDFFTCWTRKEAILKATGEGLRRPMTELTIGGPQAAPALLDLANGPTPACRMADLGVAEGYLGAAAVLTTRHVVFSVTDAAGVLSRW